MTSWELEEYKALRATIRERGTARVWIFLAGLGLWAGLATATTALASIPESTLLPLLILTAVFESVFALHVGVERIGRYIQVAHERDAEPGGLRGWEHAAMSFGGEAARSGIDPLFGTVFWIAALLNFVPAVIAGPLPIELVVIGAAHLLFIGRVFTAKRYAGRQRAADLARFTDMHASACEGNRQQ